MGPFPPSISFFALHYSQAVNIASFLSAGFKVRRIGAGLVRRMYGHYLRKIHGSIALSEAARATFEPYFPGDYRIIPCGVDTETFHPGVEPIDIPGSPRNRILYLGRLDQRKGLMNLLHAFAIVKRAVKDASMIVVGKGPLERQNRLLARKLGIAGAVAFMGYARAADIPRYYASCDLYCSPALGGESFGIVLLESMAVGTPVAASRISGYDQVISDGRNGLLFDPQDPADMAQTIARVLTDRMLRDRLIAGGAEFSRGYSWQNVAGKIEALYLEKLGCRPIEDVKPF
jgi:phosphatidylinositol alpha-mannosyltransferase